MNALDQSGELIRRGTELRARSMRMRVTAAATVEESRQLIVAAGEVQEAAMRAYGWEWFGRKGRTTAADLLAGG